MEEEKLFDLDKLLLLQGLSFTSIIFIPTISRKFVDINISFMSIEEILAIFLTLMWTLILTGAFTKINYYKAGRDKFYYLLIFGLSLTLMGTGIHLVANHFNDHLFKSISVAKELHDTAYFYDEHLGHLFVTIGYLTIMIAFLFEQSRFVCSVIQKRTLLIFGVLNGLALATLAIEGQTALLTLFTTAVIILVEIKSYGLKRTLLLDKTCTYYFLTVSLITFLVIGTWGIVNAGFPQLTEAGVI